MADPTRPVVDSILPHLVSIRRQMGLKQSEVAEAMGVSQSRVSDIESCTLDIRVATLARYAHALGLELKVTMRPKKRDVIPDANGLIWAVRFHDGSVRQQWSGRTQQQHAVRHLDELQREYREAILDPARPDKFELVWRYPYRSWRSLTDPPGGWWTFGSHAEQPVPLEFAYSGVDGLPIWERPLPNP